MIWPSSYILEYRTDHIIFLDTKRAVDYNVARDLCRGIGGELAYVRDGDEVLFLKSFLPDVSEGTVGAAVGLRFSAKESKYSWADDSDAGFDPKSPPSQLLYKSNSETLKTEDHCFRIFNNKAKTTLARKCVQKDAVCQVKSKSPFWISNLSQQDHIDNPCMWYVSLYA